MAKEKDYPSPIAAADIQDESTAWYVPDLLPRTGLVMVVGPAGQGKTSAAASILASISAGRTPLAELSTITAPRNVLILSREETLPAIKRRIKNLNADLSQVRITDQYNLRDVMRLKHEIKAGTAAIMIDSLTAFTDGNLNSRREMFGALDGLRRVAEPNKENEYPGALILLIHHTNSRSGSISDRIAGSKAIVGVIRHALHVGVHPFDDVGRVLSVCKSNIGPLNGNRTFTLGTSKKPIAWGAALDATVKELLDGSEDTPNRAVTWLMKRFEMEPGAPIAAAEIFKQAADSRGLSRRSLQRAARYLGVDTSRIGFGGNVYWKFSEDENDDPDPKQGKLIFMPPKPQGVIQ